MKPFLYKNYTITKVGINKVNTDIHNLISKIDKAMKNKQEKDLLGLKNKNDHSQTLSSISTTDSFQNNNSNNLNINIKKDNDNIIIKNNIIEKEDIIIENDNEINEKNRKKSEINKESFINKRISFFNSKNIKDNNDIQKSKSISVYKEMTSKYINKDEIELKNIERSANRKIKFIDIDLLLKKISENTFSKEENLLLYAFIKQSFSFLKMDLFINKIFQCYNYYKLKDKLNPKVQNLIDFFNVFIIEMIIYNKSITSDNEIFDIINSFYIEFEKDAINIIKSKKINKSNNDEIKKRLLNEKICTKEKDKNGKIIEWWTKGTIKVKFKNYLTKNYNKYLDIVNNIEDEFEEIIINKDIKENNKDKLQFQKNKEIKDNLGKKDSGTRQSVILRSEQLEKLAKIINNANMNLYRSNSKDNLTTKKPKEKVSEKQLIKIIGNKYENMFKNDELIMTKEDNFLFSLKNVTDLLKAKEYDEQKILNLRNKENFYLQIFAKTNKETEINKEDQTNIEPLKIFSNFLNKCFTFNIESEKLITISNYFNIFDYKPEQIAEKLISVSKNSLNKIEYKEFYCGIFTKEEKYSKSPNIMDNIQKFNNLIFFIVEDILSYDFPKDRAKIIDQWTLIAKYCKKRKDQSNCLAIHSALNHYIITGLNLTWANVKNSTKNILKEIADYCTLEGNYKIFREEIKNLKGDEYYIPYLGTLLRDLNFFEEKGKYIERESMINFQKIEQVQNALDTFFGYKNIKDKVDIEQVKELDFFDNLEKQDEQRLDKLAQDLEPEFKLNKTQDGIKRLTNIDIKYFGNF